MLTLERWRRRSIYSLGGRRGTRASALYCAQTDGAGCPGLQEWPDVRAPNPRMNSRNSILGAEIDDFGGKIGEISWMESGENWGKARSTSNKANPRIKFNKTSSNQQITKKNWGLFFGGDFRIWDKINKTRLENTTGRLRNRDQRGP